MSAADRLQQPGTLRASWAPSTPRRCSVKIAASYGGSYGSYFPHYRVPPPSDEGAAPRPAVPRAGGPLQPLRGPSLDGPRAAPVPAGAPAPANGLDEYAPLLAALRQDRDKVAALARELWRQLGALALALAAAWPQVVAAGEGAAAAAAAQLPQLQAVATDGIARTRSSLSSVATSSEARAVALGAAAHAVAGISRALEVGARSSSSTAAAAWCAAGTALTEGGRRAPAAAAAAIAPLAARTQSAAVAVLTLLRGASSGGTPTRQALSQSALIGTLLMHIPLVGGLFGRRDRQQQKHVAPVAGEWEWARLSSSDGGVDAAIAQAGRYAQAATRDLQRCVLEPVTRATGAFYSANRGPTLLLGGAAILLLALAALRRVVELSAIRAEERVMRQIELQRRAEELTSVRNRIRGALDASEPDRESRQSRQAALAAEVEEDITAATGSAGALASAARGRGRGAGPGARSSPAEQEAVRRFRAFVAASGMGEVVRAADGRMWDAGKAEGPTASREAVERATAAFRSLGPSSADDLEADRADAQRQLEEQMAELAEISGGGMGRAAREAAKQQRGLATGGGSDDAAAPRRARGGGGGDNPFALSAEEMARWEAEDGQYTEGAAARRAPRRRAGMPPPPPPIEQRRALQRLEAAEPAVVAAGEESGDAAALAASVKGRLGLGGGARAASAEDAPQPKRAAVSGEPSVPRSTPVEASAAPQEDSPEDWAKARSEMMAGGEARRARREAAMAAARKGGEKPAVARAKPAAAEPLGATVEAEAVGAAAAAAAGRDLSQVTAPPPPTAAAAAVPPAPAAPAPVSTPPAPVAVPAAAAAAGAAAAGAPVEGNPFAVDPAVLQSAQPEDGGPDDPQLFQGMRIVRRAP